MGRPKKENHTSKYDEKLARILAVASRIIAEEGYEKASVRKVASEVPLSLAGLYYYCSCKEELLFLIQYHTFDTLLTNLDKKLESKKTAKEKLKTLIENHLHYFVSNMNDLKVCSHELETLRGSRYKKVEEKRREYFERARKIIESLSKKKDREKTKLATLFLFGMLNWIYTWYSPDRKKKTEAEELAGLMTETFLKGLTVY